MRALAPLVLGGLLTLSCAARDAAPLSFDDVRYPFEVRTADLPQGAVAYVDEGPESPESAAVLLHGWTGDLRRWARAVPFLAETRRTIAFDLPGYGKSAKDPGRPYDAEYYVETLWALLDRLGVERVSLVGHSMGGQIAALAALRRPDRVERLVLVDAAGMGRGPAFADLLATEDRLAAPGRHALERVADRLFYARPANFEDALRERYALTLHEGYKAHAHAAALAYKSMQATDLYYEATKIRTPTLIVWGAEDRIFPVASALEWSRRVPGSLLAIVPRAGHLPFLERPDVFNRAVGEFLRVGRLPEIGPEEIVADPAQDGGAWSWLY